MVQNFRGSTLQQDGRFNDKDAKLMESIKFPSSFSTKINMDCVNLDAIRLWVSQTTTSMLGGIEDDILNSLIMNLLQQPNVNPKMIQIQITPFLESKASSFMMILWQLLMQAQESTDGIPPTLRELFKTSIAKGKIEKQKITQSYEHFSNAFSRNNRSSLSNTSPESDRSLFSGSSKGKYSHSPYSSFSRNTESQNKTRHSNTFHSSSPRRSGRNNHADKLRYRSRSRSLSRSSSPRGSRNYSRSRSRSRSPVIYGHSHEHRKTNYPLDPRISLNSRRPRSPTLKRK